MTGWRYAIAFGSLAVFVSMLPSAALSQRNTIAPGFVYLRSVDSSIQQDMRYAGRDNFTGRPLPGYHAAECILLRPAALALKQVQADLAAQKLSLKVYDCYRPTQTVTAMANWTRDGQSSPGTARFHPGIKKQDLFSLGFISGHSAHSRGVAVDLTLVPLDGTAPPVFDPESRYGSCAGPVAKRSPDNSLDMGTGYDCFDKKSATRSPSITAEQKSRRKLLVDAMARHGFRNYFREWWHFSYPSADPQVEYNFPVDRR